ncbi:MAG: ATP-binding cassette domain-containing protein [Actinobacteria bacterium]|jgi:alpha-D-ribose 1-methylphosphonate 5-triphosphate synthase subunit PhnL|nr:ATP-binding cassette domain-containing protein [Actinomycetota bacterium]
MSSQSVLDVVQLHKSFVLHNIDGRRVDALTGVDLHVNVGEHVALAGSSGAGKSSLLKCIYRTYTPTSGDVILTDTDGTRLALSALGEREMVMVRGRRLGYVSQFLRAQPRRTPMDIVTAAGILRGTDVTTARVLAMEALDRLRLDKGLWDVHTSVLSGGERQRVNLAAGTISPPRLLLLDEPVSALDPANRTAALDVIADLSAQGVAVLSVFHDLEAMERLASRIVVMRDGRIESDGPPIEILSTLRAVAR